MAEGEYMSKVGLSDKCLEGIGTINRLQNGDLIAKGLILDLSSTFVLLQTFEIVMALPLSSSPDSVRAYISLTAFRKQVRHLEEFVKRLRKNKCCEERMR